VFIITYNQRIVRLTWNVTKTCKYYTLLVKITFTITSLSFLLQSEIVEENVTIHATTSETHIIVIPVDAADFIIVTFTLHIQRAFLCVKVKNVNSAGSYSSCKHMSTVTEFYLSTAFQLQTW